MSLKMKRLVPLALMAIVAGNFFMENQEASVARMAEEDMIGRALQFASNSMDFYELVGDGRCLDASSNGYDWQYIDKNIYTVEECAKQCARRLLMEEHVGMMYDDTNAKCYCLWDNDEMPERFANKGDLTLIGSGPIVSAAVVNATSDTTLDCFKKKTSAMAPAVDSYKLLSECSSEDESVNIDVTSWTGVTSVEGCASKCLRFSLYSFHLGFEYDPNVLTCDCQFLEGEAPHIRVLPKSSERKTRVKKKDMRAARKAGNKKATELPSTCMSKKGYEEPDPSLRIDPATLAEDRKQIWINEIHYRNQGPDTPYIEVIGPYGMDPNGFKVIFYQARNGRQFSDSYDLSDDGILTNMHYNNGWGFHVIDIPPHKIRKGKMGGDGVALVYEDTECVQFFSYTHTGLNHTFKAASGPCENVVSTPMGVLEGRLTPEYQSLQLVGGPGGAYEEFEWMGPLNATKGSVNVGQTLTPTDPVLPAPAY